jgi:hypothetical protein
MYIYISNIYIYIYMYIYISNIYIYISSSITVDPVTCVDQGRLNTDY